MLDVGIVDDRPYAALVAAYGKAGLTDNVNKILETMKASGVEASTTLYNTLINIHSKAEAPEKARAVLQLMQADGKSDLLFIILLYNLLSKMVKMQNCGAKNFFFFICRWSLNDLVSCDYVEAFASEPD